MFSRMDKAWAAGIATFLINQVEILGGIDLNPNIEALIMTAIVGLVVWLVPNKPAA